MKNAQGNKSGSDIGPAEDTMGHGAALMMGLSKNKGNRKVKLAILATLATFTTAFAGIKYDIPMMDVRDEAGSNESRLGDMCIAGKKHWGVL